MRIYNYCLKRVVYYYLDKETPEVIQEPMLPPMFKIYGKFTDAEMLQVLTKDMEDSLEKIDLLLINPQGNTLALLFKNQKTLWGMPWVLVERPLKLYHFHMDKRSGYYVAHSKLEVLIRLEHNFIIEKHPNIVQVPLDYGNASITITPKINDDD